MRFAAGLAIPLIWACARPSTAEPAIEQPAIEQPAAVTVDPRCEEQRDAVLAAIRQSQSRSCEDDRECAAITSPRSVESSLRVVVHVDDAATLEASTRQLLAACGETASWDHVAGYVAVTPRCNAGTCAAEEWSVAPLE